MRLRQALFWDVDPNTIDIEKHARYVIERVLDFGTDEEVRWMFKQYPRSKIVDALNQTRSTVLPKSRALWELILK
ncbi:MAG: hypothetical protein AAB555_00875 [Patescibacteria group bacterium]